MRKSELMSLLPIERGLRLANGPVGPYRSLKGSSGPAERVHILVSIRFV